MAEPGDEHIEVFARLRPLLFTIAYEVLGSVTEADDVLQESYLRWARVDLRDVVDPKAYLARIVTRQSLNALRAAARRREDYVGPWLPEPLLAVTEDPSSDVVLAESVSMAMMVVLETLTPDERVVFVLREVFQFSHDEIADVVGKSGPAVRQVAHRARQHVHARRRRFEPVDRSRSAAVAEGFFQAAASGDVGRLVALLDPDATWTADGGGVVRAALRPVVGADRVARLIVGLARAEGEGRRVEPAFCNGYPALVLYLDDVLDGVVLLEVAEGRIAHVYAIRNPDKLPRTTDGRRISR